MTKSIKYISLILVSLLFAYKGVSQNTVNYILERTMLAPTPDENLVFDSAGLQTMSYFDGLGRPIQQVGMNQSPSGADIIQIIDYDDFGREAVKYMPYTQDDNNGAFIPIDDAKAANSEFFKPFFGANEIFTAETAFDGSPLNRPIEQGAPGLDWQLGDGVPGEHTVKFTYGTNIANDVKKWTINNNGMAAADYAGDGTYAENILYVNTTTDENQKQSKEYKNLQGQVVLTESFDGATPLRTYYIYDDFGHLRCVVPPASVDASGKSIVNDKYCYFYRYDHRKRMIEKKIPGAEAIYMVYDSRDRLVLTQDGNMRQDSTWMATIYDNLNRPKKTGIYVGVTGEGQEESRQDLADKLDVNITGGSIDYIKNQTIDELSQTFYDNYDELDAELTTLGLTPTDYHYNKPAGDNDFEANENTAVKGQITFTKTLVPDMENWLITVNYYDDKYRVIQTIADNHLGGRDIISNRYDFVGKVLETKQEHTIGESTEIITKTFDYDHAGRLTETKMDVGGTGLKTVSTNEYNELGQLKGKNTHNASGQADFIKTTYNYNIRGWMTTMGNKDKDEANLFTLDLGYNQGDNAQYNGNISSMNWTSTNQAGPNYYDFKYDDINRLTAADYNGEATGNYSTSYSYDSNGNIKTLSRNGFIKEDVFDVIDNLAYKYDGNRLAIVDDINTPEAQDFGFSDNGLFNATESPTDTTKHEYFYDANGNLTADYNKGIEAVHYNHLNLPRLVDLGNNRYIEYIYDAAGIKLQRRVYEDGDLQKETDYIGNFVYENGSLAYILSDDGRLVPKEGATGYDYEYYIKDHLGNTRVTVKDNSGTAEIVQESHYYPFGMQMEGVSTALEEGLNRYLYNGKELQDDLGLDWYDYGARFYDAQLGRWHSVDPHTESYFSFSPYNYVYNNPMAFVDPTGMDPEQDFYDDMEENNKKFKEWIESQTGSNNNSFDFSLSKSNQEQTTNSNNGQICSPGNGKFYLLDGKLIYLLPNEKVPPGAKLLTDKEAITIGIDLGLSLQDLADLIDKKVNLDANTADIKVDPPSPPSNKKKESSFKMPKWFYSGFLTDEQALKVADFARMYGNSREKNLGVGMVKELVRRGGKEANKAKVNELQKRINQLEDSIQKLNKKK